MSIDLIFSLLSLAFLGWREFAVCHSRLWHSVSGSFSKIHDSSPVITQLKNPGSLSRRFRSPTHTFLQLPFCSVVRFFGTTLVPSFSTSVDDLTSEASSLFPYCCLFMRVKVFCHKMAPKRLKKMLFFTMALVSIVFCFLIKLSSDGICIFCQRKSEVPSFKRDTGNFLQLPLTDCSRNPPFLVILATSSHTQSKARMAIRETWGKEKLIDNKRIVTYFLLGTTLNHDDQHAVTAESLKYGDIIQKDFTDTYYNLTRKTMMGIEWVHKFCPQSSFVMKTDSDVFVNTYYLTELLLKKNRNTRFFTGFLKLNERPIRETISKWYVSKEEYPANTYPPFCSGTGYVFSSDVASQVYNISENVLFVKLEDVFIGLCLAELNIKLEELDSKQTFFPERLTFSPCSFKKIVTSHFVKPHELLIYWNALERSMDEKCPSSDYHRPSPPHRSKHSTRNMRKNRKV
nr:beta-1,3-galactosyltransferase 5-like isoform X1 [Anolis sagrei ordinatus]